MAIFYFGDYCRVTVVMNENVSKSRVFCGHRSGSQLKQRAIPNFMVAMGRQIVNLKGIF